MKAITIWQPFATAIAAGVKKFETRSWETKYRGKIAIHAAARKITSSQIEDLENIFVIYGVKNPFDDFGGLPLGGVVAVADLVDCQEITTEFTETLPAMERALGDYTAGRYAWQLENIRILENPITAKGQQGLWNFKVVE